MGAECTDKLFAIAKAASEQFNALHGDAATDAGVISATLRSMGVNAEAVKIDCAHSGKRLVLIVLDQEPDKVGIGIGQKETVGNYELVGKSHMDEITEAKVFDILQARFP